MEAYRERSLGTAEIDGAKTCSSEAPQNDLGTAEYSLPTGLASYNRFLVTKGRVSWYDILDNVSFKAKVLAWNHCHEIRPPFRGHFWPAASVMRWNVKAGDGRSRVVDRCWPLTPPNQALVLNIWGWVKSNNDITRVQLSRLREGICLTSSFKFGGVSLLCFALPLDYALLR